jgi:hypothetical protein
MVTSCKKRVYKTMCEKNDKGYRVGGTKKVRYESVRKGSRLPKGGRK